MKILIIGWYGTETVGDKAILAGIIQDYHRRFPSFQLTIASIYPFITRQTLQELRIEAKIIPTYSPKFPLACASADEVVMGGGPLMDMDALSIPLWGFFVARIFGKRRVIFGCGLGPLKQPQYIEAVKRILRLADEVYLRDSASVALAQQFAPGKDYKQIDDPAKDYLVSLPPASPSSDHPRRVALFLRDWPRNYAASLSDNEYNDVKERFERNLGSSLARLAEQYAIELNFYAMHTFSVGEDDRAFNRRFISTYLDGVNVNQAMTPSSVSSIVYAMQSAEVCICMRYHSVLFAHTLGREFAAIDYTMGGKIEGYLNDARALDRYTSLEEIAAGNLDRLERIIQTSVQTSEG